MKNKLSERKDFGNKGEKLVSNYLLEKSFTIIETNFSLNKYGEIDIIAKKENLIIFVEVKTRSSHYCDINRLISQKQQICISKIAIYFCQKNNILVNDKTILRFDAAFVYGDNVLYYENAFSFLY